MTERALESRIARLERRATLWQLVAIGSAIVTCGLITNACDKSSPQATATTPDHLQFGTGDFKVRIDQHELVITGPKSTLRLDSDGLEVSLTGSVIGKRSTLRGGELAIHEGTDRLTRVMAGRMKLESQGRAIDADVTKDKDAWLLALANHGRTTMAARVNDAGTATIWTSSMTADSETGVQFGTDNTSGPSLRVYKGAAEKLFKLGK